MKEDLTQQLRNSNPHVLIKNTCKQNKHLNIPTALIPEFKNVLNSATFADYSLTFL